MVSDLLQLLDLLLLYEKAFFFFLKPILESLVLHKGNFLVFLSERPLFKEISNLIFLSFLLTLKSSMFRLSSC